MDTIIFAWLLVILAATSPMVQGDYNLGSHIIDVPKTIKETRLHFFMHDILSGDSPTAVRVAKANDKRIKENNDIVPFGTIFVFDDPLTEGADPKSKVIGNARGLYASVSRGSDLTLLFNGDFEFMSGEFNGSSISVASRDPLVLVKEVAVVGGRGKLKMAKGFALINAVYFNATTGDAILEWHVTIYHP
ncbi:dirigent protein 4-like [Bidens hawaiensis]|uniref:dirigent protein 4-like n=1 Tax=Bidens hawaiensis TaxID=980011 RepID=UPI00404B87B5